MEITQSQLFALRKYYEAKVKTYAYKSFPRICRDEYKFENQNIQNRFKEELLATNKLLEELIKK
jgi:hypothetical protein